MNRKLLKLGLVLPLTILPAVAITSCEEALYKGTGKLFVDVTSITNLNHKFKVSRNFIISIEQNRKVYVDSKEVSCTIITYLWPDPSQYTSSWETKTAMLTDSIRYK